MSESPEVGYFYGEVIRLHGQSGPSDAPDISHPLTLTHSYQMRQCYLRIHLMAQQAGAKKDTPWSN